MVQLFQSALFFRSELLVPLFFNLSSALKFKSGKVLFFLLTGLHGHVVTPSKIVMINC
jgi:hypothetical protein